jgi:uncharacterized protein
VAFIDTVNRAITEAMKAREANRLSTLRMLKTALVNRSLERGHELDDAEGIQTVASLIKQRRDSIEQFRAGGRQDLVDKELAEVAILETYLPPAMDEAEIDRLIDAAIAETGATSAKEMGRVMKAAMARLAGTGVDGNVVSQRVRQKLVR